MAYAAGGVAVSGGATAADARAHPSQAPGPSPASRPPIAAMLLVAATALVFRPYRGLTGDARIYIGRAIATLDPAGVGRDLMFAHDHQSTFSVFPALLTRAVAWLGPTTAAAAVSLCLLAAWTLAAAGMVNAFVGRRAALLSLLAVLILPSAYSGFQLGTGEAAPLPRPAAEALVLLGLWALLRGRRLPAAGLMLTAAAVHPIMAAPGLGVLYLVLCLEDRRWLILAGIGAVAAVAGAALRLPVLERLTEVMDGRWLAVLHACSPPLFLSTWPDEAWSQTAARAATLGLAVVLLQGRPRRVAAATLAVVAAALAASALLGDVASSVLALQAQVWRALWLLSVLSAAVLPLTVGELWARGAVTRLAAGALLCAWLATALAPVSVTASLACVLLVLLSARGAAVARHWLTIGWGLVVLGAALTVVGEGAALVQLVLASPEPMRQPLRFYLLLGLVRVVAMIAVLGFAAAWRKSGRKIPALLATAAAALLLAAAVPNWTSLGVESRFLDSPVAAREVRAITASRPGEVLWLGGELQPVLLAGRPAWWTEVQAASSVFSREQALIWAARRDRLVATGVGPPGLLEPFPHEQPLLWTPSPSQNRAFCAFPDAPAWIVQPVRQGAAAPAGARLWRSPVATPRALSSNGPVELVETYAFLPCR